MRLYVSLLLCVVKLQILSYSFALLGAQMVMTDVSGRQDRADALGKLGVAYGVGMVVGPPIGGELVLCCV